MKLYELRSECVEILLREGTDRPFYAVDLIISRVLGIERALLITKGEMEIPAQKCVGILSMTEERSRRVPLSYILGEAEFYGRPFEIGEGCLIPRPETELLVEEMLRACPNASRFADWCTGSGCIGITLILENDNLSGYGIDSSQKALDWAVLNTNKYNLNSRFDLICNSDPSVCGIESGSLDFIVANPPYIPTKDIDGLMADVRDHEPLEALDGGEDGADLYRLFFTHFPKLLKDEGLIGFEIAGDEQAEILLSAAPPDFVLTNRIFDYNGILRHLTWKKN
ncbi:MAG: peptide chain release factor N(5)-glutamine methyltransferase [Synergistaceae bacterium]